MAVYYGSDNAVAGIGRRDIWLSLIAEADCFCRLKLFF